MSPIRKMRRQVFAKKNIVGTLTIFVMMLLVVFTSMFIIMPEQAKAASTDFTYNKLITIDHTKVNESHTNMVIWVHNTSTDFKSVANGGKLQADADDIAFFSQDNNTQYKHDIELYDATTGEIGIWVNISDTIHGGSDFRFYCYYTDSDGTDQRDMDGTWDSKYSAVYHMNHSTFAFDSSGNGLHLTNNAIPTFSQTGKLGKCVQLDGANDFMNHSSDTHFNMSDSEFTHLFWFNADAGSFDTQRTCSEKSTGTHRCSMVAIRADTGYSMMWLNDNAVGEQLVFSGVKSDDGNWHMVVGIRENDRTAGHDWLRINLDGQKKNETDMGNYGSLDNIENFSIGATSTKSNAFKGYLDEIWIVKGTAFNTSYIETVYNNTNSPDTFLSFGTQEGNGGTASTFTIKGLPNDIITFSGVAGSTVYCNSSGDTNEWLEYNMSINATDNVTELRVYMDDLNDTSAYINASNITMFVSSDNSSYGEMGTFTDGGSNCSSHINSTNWNAGTMGANPFLGAGLTDKNVSIYLIFKITLPSGTPTDIFWASTSLACKIYPGHYV